jgi:hypothetical protein
MKTRGRGLLPLCVVVGVVGILCAWTYPRRSFAYCPQGCFMLTSGCLSQFLDREYNGLVASNSIHDPDADSSVQATGSVTRTRREWDCDTCYHTGCAYPCTDPMKSCSSYTDYGAGNYTAYCPLE